MNIFNQKLKSKIFLIFFLVIFLLSPSITKTATIEELQAQILKLRAQIGGLEKQLVEIQKSKFWCSDFLTDLKYGQKGKEIKALQIALEKEKLFSGPVTGYFGPITRQSVKIFQEKYQKEILEPWGFRKGTGLVGPTTRTKLNELYGCTKIYISSFFPQQGDTLIIKVKTDLPAEKIKGYLGNKDIKFSKIKENLVSIVGISAKEKPKKYNLVIFLPEGKFLTKELNIVERRFPVTKLMVTEELKEKGFTPTKIKENLAKENLVLNKALSVFTPQFYFDQAFIYPLEKIKEVGAFGNIRKSGETILQHLGVDLEAEVGTPVYAINDGIIRLSQELTNYGKTIVIDHGMGIFSLYLHLDEFKVWEGKEVKKGETIALSGNTGYSIAPHLHLSVKINGTSVDPIRFIDIIEKKW